MSKANENFSEIASSLFKGMDGYLSTKTVVGNPITIDDTVIIPMVNVSFGIGAGAIMSDKKDNGMGGMGGKMSPGAVLIIHNGTTRLINIATHSGIDKILDLLPDFVDRFKTDKEAKAGAAKSNADEKTRAKAKEAFNDMIDESIVDENEI